MKIGNYYIGFNRKYGFNSETREAGDLVTVHEKLGTAIESRKSKLVAMLDIGDDYIIPINEWINVRVVSKGITGFTGPVSAGIDISLEEPPPEAVGCNDAFFTDLDVTVTTDLYQNETSWEILDVFDNVVYSRSYQHDSTASRLFDNGAYSNRGTFTVSSFGCIRTF